MNLVIENMYVCQASFLPIGTRFDPLFDCCGDPRASISETGKFRVVGHAKKWDYKVGRWYASVLIVKA